MTTEMLSPRTAIRQKACGILRAALPVWLEGFTPDRVHESLSVPLNMKRLPVVLVYTRDERLEDDGGHADPGLRLRTLDLAVEIVAGGDEATDFLCAAVEAIMDAHETLGNLVQGIRLQRIAADRDSDGEKTVVAARMEFEVTYYTRSALQPASDADGASGNSGVPAYPDCAVVIPGMTPTLAELEEAGGAASGAGYSGQSLQMLTSAAPFIGPEYEPRYEPAPTP